jgi:hypothetical protein
MPPLIGGTGPDSQTWVDGRFLGFSSRNASFGAFWFWHVLALSHWLFAIFIHFPDLPIGPSLLNQINQGLAKFALAVWPII